MKNFAINAAVALYVIFTISGTTCSYNENCGSINDRCNTTLDCCHQKCSFSLFQYAYTCADNTNIYNYLTPYFYIKVQQGYCIYTNTTDDETSDDMYNTYGLNVAHPRLEQDTRVEVLLNSKKMIATVNNNRATSKGVILELSREVAKIMNVEAGVKIPCEVYVPLLENNPYFKYIMYVTPYLFLFTVLFGI